jgi:methylmalonyl-CoA mutase
LRIEEAAARTQARIDSGRQPVIGINMLRPDENEEPIQVRKVDNSVGAHAARSTSCRRPSRGTRRAGHAMPRWPRSLRRPMPHSTAAGSNDLDRQPAWRWRSTPLARTPPLGEISDALEKVYGRHTSHEIRTISGVYRSKRWVRAATIASSSVRRKVEAFERRTTVVAPGSSIAKMGQDGHDRGQKVVATGYRGSRLRRRHGSAVRRPPPRSHSQAVEADVHMVAASSLAAGHLTLVPELKHELAELGRSDIMIVVGGVIPPQDFDALYEAGAAAIFPPGTVIADAAGDLLDKLTATLA